MALPLVSWRDISQIFMCLYKRAEAKSCSLPLSLPLRQMEGPGLGKGLGASTAHVPCAARQGYPLTPLRLPKAHPCLLLHPPGWAMGCGPCITSLVVLCPPGRWAPRGPPDTVPRCWVSQRGSGLHQERRAQVSGAMLRLPAANTWALGCCRCSLHMLSPWKTTAFPYVSVFLLWLPASSTAAVPAGLQEWTDMHFCGLGSEWQEKALPLSHTLQTPIDPHYPYDPFHSSLYLKCLCRWTTKETNLRNGENLHLVTFQSVLVNQADRKLILYLE